MMSLSEPVDLTASGGESADGNLPPARHQAYMLFSTGFTGKWCLDVDGNRIEIALDLGVKRAELPNRFVSWSRLLAALPC